jgi:hypothetical protein
VEVASVVLVATAAIPPPTGHWTSTGRPVLRRDGILVGTGASYYSQFKNASGYYTLLDDGGYGVNTNGQVYAASFSQSGVRADFFGGMFSEIRGCYQANAYTGACSCPSGYSAVDMLIPSTMDMYYCYLP